jgi:hypothetical protein
VLVASSRSASTALPREQNQPGRRLAQAAHPTGTCRAACFCRAWVPAEFSMCVIYVHRPLPVRALPRHADHPGRLPRKAQFRGENAQRLPAERPFSDESLPKLRRCGCDGTHINAGAWRHGPFPPGSFETAFLPLSAQPPVGFLTGSPEKPAMPEPHEKFHQVPSRNGKLVHFGQPGSYNPVVVCIRASARFRPPPVPATPGAVAGSLCITAMDSAGCEQDPEFDRHSDSAGDRGSRSENGAFAERDRSHRL